MNACDSNLEKKRCDWAKNQSKLYVKYHDEEWGVPVYDDRVLFEFLILEGAQAGLSWSTILNRRTGYWEAFAEFDPQKVAQFDERKIQELLQCDGIIRNQLKIRSAVNNAKLFLEVQRQFGAFSTYIWQFVDNKPIVGNWKTQNEIPTTSPESDALSKDLKKRGFKFVGSTIMYAYMQACGLVNDHILDCFRFKEV